MNRLNLNTETWGMKIFELLDYDTYGLHSDSFKIRNDGSIFRVNNNIIYNNDDDCITNDHELLLKIKKNDTYYEVMTNENNEKRNFFTSNYAWFVLKKKLIDEKMNNYKLQVGDIIKIGKVIIRIKEIAYDTKKEFKRKRSESIKSGELSKKDSKDIFSKATRNKQANFINYRNITNPNFEDNIELLKMDKDVLTDDFLNKIKKKNEICKVCYNKEEDENENPLIRPCYCSGSIKYIHLKCFKHWVTTGITKTKNEYCTTFLFKERECEICKAKLPDYIYHKGKLFPLIDFSNEYNNYLILESLTLEEDKNRFIFIVSLDKNRHLKIGRGIENEIILKDPSVSRMHCKLNIERHQIFIHDSDSKYGTLILVQVPSIRIEENVPLNIQVGRTFLKFKIKNNDSFFSFCSCCEISENANLLYYYTLNERQIKINKEAANNNNENNELSIEELKKFEIETEKGRRDYNKSINSY